MSAPYEATMVVTGLLTLALLIWAGWCIWKYRRRPEWAALEAAVPSAVLSALIIGFAVFWSGYVVQLRDSEKTDSESSRLNEKDVLQALRRELSDDQTFLRARSISLWTYTAANYTDVMNAIIAQPIESFAWDSLSNSGQTHWIREPTLLVTLSGAYFALRNLQSWELRSIDAFNGATLTFTPSNGQFADLTQRTVFTTKSLFKPTGDQVARAVQAIDAQLLAD